MWWLFLSKRKRLERKIRILSNRLNNLDRINKGYRSDINASSTNIKDVKQTESILLKKRREQVRVERKRTRLTRQLNNARNDLARLK